MPKIDFKRTLKELYAPPQDLVVVEVPELQYLMVDGQGEPGGPSYLDAVEALYAVAYKLKFASKQQADKDYVVPPLEGLWGAADMAAYTSAYDRSKWQWTMMIMTPAWIDRSLFEDTLEVVRKGKNPPALDLVRLETLSEGTSVQIMHIGSYADEAPTIRRIHEEFIPDNGYTENGRHHEIYLGDPRKVAPEKLRTVLRQPIRPA
ncbi:MAG: hypothetical protein GY720_11770 [bacterium]|nr:hypothetical protein [bacterium]